LKILLVENSKTARAVLSNLLEKEGYAVETVSTGAEALEAFEIKHFDLLIMDVFMPEMNGYEAAQKIRAIKSKKANTPIIGLSSSTNERDRRLCIESGMNEFIVKTEHNDDLIAALRRYELKMI
jgi:CheY-like chemotaxis protein